MGSVLRYIIRKASIPDLGVNTVVVCGCNFPNCPRTTIYEASERDFRIILAKDATSLTYDTGLQELQNIGVSLMNTDECIVWLRASSYSKIQNRPKIKGGVLIIKYNI
jgi:nicotinamidase-related amidase